MKTYGVSFDDFKPDCGIEEFEKMSSVYILGYEQSMNEAKVAEESNAKTLALLKELISNFDAFIKLRHAVVDAFHKELSIKGGNLFRFVKEVVAEPDRISSIENVMNWMEDIPDDHEYIREIIDYSREVCEREAKKIQRGIEACRCAIEFYRKAKDIYRFQHVFDKVDIMYKASVCREMVRDLNEFKILCNKYRTAYSSEETEDSKRILKHVAYFSEYCDKQLIFYRKLRKMIDQIGVDEALKHIYVRECVAED